MASRVLRSRTRPVLPSPLPSHPFPAQVKRLSVLKVPSPEPGWRLLLFLIIQVVVLQPRGTLSVSCKLHAEPQSLMV